MFRGIETRHTPRGPFVALPVPHALVQSGVVAADTLGARLVFVGDAQRKQAAADVAAEAERVQFARDAFRRELAELVGEGAFGTPRAYARIAKAVVSHVDLGPRYAARARDHVTVAPLLGFLLADPGRASLVRAGRAFERVALLAAAEGFAVQPISKPVQVPGLRGKLAALVDAPAESWRCSSDSAAAATRPCATPPGGTRTKSSFTEWPRAAQIFRSPATYPQTLRRARASRALTLPLPASRGEGKQLQCSERSSKWRA